MNYWIKLNDGRWLKVSENIYIDWNGEKDVTIKLNYLT